jgi:serine/threonine-protein kinase
LKKIGKYIVCGLLGRGGMSTVYKVRMPVTGKIVALKLLSPHPNLLNLLGEEEIKRRFTSEAVTMAHLRHPHIVDVWDFNEADGNPFFLMEYYCNNLGSILGETYRVEDPSRILSLDKTIHYTRQILMGLSRLHQAGIIHRDIKPYNILVTDEDTVKISDFGLSKLRGERFPGPRHLIVGSPYYAAPEQEKDPDQIDVQADIYSTGVMVHRMLTGLLPLEEGKKPSEWNPNLDAEWDRFLLKAVAPQREDRFANVKEMLKTFDTLHSVWEDKKRNQCQESFTDSVLQSPVRSSFRKSLRAQSIKVRPREASRVFGTDKLGRPLNPMTHDFLINGDETVTDKVTGLTWQQSGSDFPMTWEQAHVYIQNLNDQRFAGLTPWRLPTIDELLSLITEVPHKDDFCLRSVFDPHQRWLWSSDRRSFVAAWYVSADMGFVSWQDSSCYYFARGVCSG